MRTITIKDIKALRIEVNHNRDAMMKRFGFSHEENVFHIVHNFWLDQKDSKFDKHMVEFINTMVGEKNMAGATNALRLRFRFPRELTKAIVDKTGAMYYVEIAKHQIAKTLLQLLVERGKIDHEMKEVEILSSTGKKLKKFSPWMEFQEKVKLLVEDDGMPRGMYSEPGKMLSRGLKLKSWEPQRKYTAQEKVHLRRKSSIGFRLIKRDRDWWETYFHQRPDYVESLKRGAEDGGEDELNLEHRISKYVDIIMELSELERFYLTWWLGSRGRSYLDLTFPGIKGHGDSVEKHILERADAWVITEVDIEEAQIACGHLYNDHYRDMSKHNVGKVNDSVALNKWKKHSKKIMTKLMDESINSMGDILYHEGLIEIATANAGDYTHRLIGKDLSTNGFAMIGSTCRDPKIMKACNISGHKNVYYAHGVMSKFFNLTIKQVKDHVSTALFHGSGAKAISSVLSSKLNRDFGPKLIRTALVDSFGENVLYMNKIAKWVSSLYTNMNTSLKMRGPNGAIYFAQAYATQNKLDIQGLSFNTKDHRSKVQIICEMPLLFSNDGKKVINVLVGKSKTSKGGEIKMTGGEAHITHMFDGTNLMLAEADFDVHDNFFGSGRALRRIADVIKTSHKGMASHNQYESAMIYMRDTRKDKSKSVAPIPQPIYGVSIEKAHEMIENSTNFLQQ